MSKCRKCAPSKAGVEPDDQTLCDSCNAREQQLGKLRSSSRSDVEVTAAAAAEQDATSLPTSSSMASPAEGTVSPSSGTANDANGSVTVDTSGGGNNQLCHEQCKSNRSESGDMIRCCLCFHWHHERCVDEVDNKTTWWVCRSCRSMSTSVNVLTTMLVQQQDIMNQLMQTNATLVTSVHDLMVKNDALATQVNSLSSQVTSLLNQQPVSKTQAITAQHTPSPTLLIGASTIRDIACTDQNGLYIISRGGAKTGDILKCLKEMKDSSYGDVIVHVGTNDCSTKFPVEKICENLTNIVTQAKRVSRTGCVTLSSITPRIDNPSAAAKSGEVNDGMKRVAEESGCVFANNQDNFLCRNGEINKELLLLDGLHLSKLGTERLIKQLKTQCLGMLSHRKIDKTWWRPPTQEGMGLRWTSSIAYATSCAAALSRTAQASSPAQDSFPASWSHSGHRDGQCACKYLWRQTHGRSTSTPPESPGPWGLKFRQIWSCWLLYVLWRVKPPKQ